MNAKSAHHASSSPSKASIHHELAVKSVPTSSEKITSSILPPASTPFIPALSSTTPSPSSLSIPAEQSPSSSASSTSIIGGILGGIIICLSIIIYALYRRIKKKKHHQRHSAQNGGWNVTRSWSTLDTDNSKCITDMNVPPPAYYSSTRAKKRLTQDSVISKQSSFVKQYSPQLAYSPSQTTILKMDHESVSPSHTLVDTSGSSWLHQKDLSLPEYEDDQQQQQQQQQRRSIQPYQAQLDISSSFSDALDPPGTYHSGIILHTQDDIHPSYTS